MKTITLLFFILLHSFFHAQNWAPATPFISPCGQYQNGIQGGVTKIVEFNNELYTSGNFNEAGGIIAHCIARWNGSSWNTIYQGDLIQNSVVHDMIVFNNKLYFIGDHLYTWDGTTIDTVLYIDQSTGFSYDITHASSNFCIYNGDLFIGNASVLFKITANNLVTFDDLSGGGSVAVDVGDISSLEVLNGDFYLGSQWGVYKNINGAWTSITGNTFPWILDLVSFENNLYALGEFSAIGLVTANNFAKYDGQSWTNETLIPNALVVGNQWLNLVLPNSLNVINNSLIFTYPTTCNPSALPHVFAKQNGLWSEIGTFDLTDQIWGQCYTSCIFQNEIYVGGAFANGLNNNPTICNLMKIGSVLNVSNNEGSTFKVNYDKQLIELESPSLCGDIQIFDISGKQVQKFNTSEYKIKIDFSNYISGTYFLRVNNSESFLFVKYE